MSLQSFQQALVDVTLSPWMMQALRQGDAQGLAKYDLSVRERARIFDIADQPGILVHSSLSRGNRFELIVKAFPMTCVLLRPTLRRLIDELWREYQPTNYQLLGEQTAFAAIVRQKIEERQLTIAYLDEILGYETACLELVHRMRSDENADVYTTVEFHHSPDDLLPPLSRLKLPPTDLPEGSYSARVRFRGEQFKVELLTRPSPSASIVHARHPQL